MKVIFTQTVPGVGRPDEVREVADGYALNYLLPRKLAIQATVAALAAVADRAGRRQHEQDKQLAQAQGYLSQLQGKLITVTTKAAPSGTLYAALTLEQIAEAIQQASKVPLTPAQLVLAAHLKTVGDHAVSVRLPGNLTAKLTVRVQPA